MSTAACPPELARPGSLHASHPPGDEHRRLARPERVARLLEEFFRHAHRLLVEPSDPAGAGQAARRFLARRGFDLGALDHLPLGLFTDPRTLGHRLGEAGFSAREIEASELLADPRLSGRLIGPIRDRHGRIVSFWARHPDDQPPHWLFKGPWRDQVGLFGLDVALRPEAGGQEHLVIVEDVLDAVLLHGRGLRNVAALASPVSGAAAGRVRRQLAAEPQWRHAATAQIARATLAVDPPQADPQNLLDALEPLLRAPGAPEVFVLLPDELDEYGRLGELIRRASADALRSILHDASLPAYSVRACAILENHRAGRPWTEPRRHAAWKEAVFYYASSGPAAAPQLDKYFVPVIVAGLGRSWDTFQPCPGIVGEDELEEPEPTGEPAEPSVHLAEAPRDEPKPIAPARDGFCTVHRCAVTACFCFD